MKIYAAHGLTDFLICCGYKGYVIKEYFQLLLHAPTSRSTSSGEGRRPHRDVEPWTVTLVDTGDVTRPADGLPVLRTTSTTTTSR